MEHVEDYGWAGADKPYSGSYITPKVCEVMRRLGVKRLLDLGAGNGYLVGQLAKEGYDVAGVEYDAAGCKVAQAAYPSLKFYNFGVQDDPAQLLATESPFDAVISTEVVEHLFAPHLLPLYANQVLKPSGFLVVTTPYHGYLKNFALAVAGKWDHHHSPLWHGGHIKFFSRDTLTKLLEQNGFDVVEFHGIGRAPFLWKSMMLVARKSKE